MRFDKNIKLYLLKDDKIKLCLKVSDNFVHHFIFDTELFEDMLSNWRTGWKTDSWNIKWKRRGPRPEKTPVSYVAISFFPHDQGLNFRFSYDDMVVLEKDYFYQKYNKMHWDKNDIEK